ncbi:MAG TPA: hypothetical protein VK365_05935 [Nocardioidaceae bacterium]|jgi:hypothetical protein|nr:hypothetical protein [Nocardioidaceae bacterium]
MAAACLSAAAVAGVAACGPPTSTSASEPESSAAPTESAPGEAGLPAGADNGSDIEALSGFACGPGADASWSARGTLTNTGQHDASYVLTVVVAGPESTAVQAKRRVVAVPAGASEAVRLGNLPVSAEGELSCHAQVVRQ